MSGRLCLPASTSAMNARDRARVERLREEAGRADREGLLLGFRRCLAGEKDEWDVARARVRRTAVASSKPSSTGMLISSRTRRRSLVETLEALLPVARLDHVKAVQRQIRAADQADVRVVVDDEHPRSGRTYPGGRASRTSTAASSFSRARVRRPSRCAGARSLRAAVRGRSLWPHAVRQTPDSVALHLHPSARLSD